MKKKYKIILTIISVVISIIITSFVLFNLLLDSISYQMDVFDFSRDYIVNNEYFEAYYDSNTNNGFTIPVTFNNISDKKITIESIECKQLYKNENISDNYEISLSSDKNKYLPLIIYPENHSDNNNMFSKITFDTINNFNRNDFQIGDKVYVEIAMEYKIDNKEYKVVKEFTKTYLKKKYYNLP